MRKIIIIIIAVFIIAGIYKTYTRYKENSFIKLKDSSIVINETFNGLSKEDVNFYDDADVPIFVRARIVINYLDDLGNIVSFIPIEGEDYSIEINPQWLYEDRYYYLDDPVISSNIPVLIEKLVNLNDQYKLSVDIMVQCSDKSFR